MITDSLLCGIRIRVQYLADSDPDTTWNQRRINQHAEKTKNKKQKTKNKKQKTKLSGQKTHIVPLNCFTIISKYVVVVILKKLFLTRSMSWFRFTFLVD